MSTSDDGGPLKWLFFVLALLAIATLGTVSVALMVKVNNQIAKEKTRSSK